MAIDKGEGSGIPDVVEGAGRLATTGAVRFALQALTKQVAGAYSRIREERFNRFIEDAYAAMEFGTPEEAQKMFASMSPEDEARLLRYLEEVFRTPDSQAIPIIAKLYAVDTLQGGIDPRLRRRTLRLCAEADAADLLLIAEIAYQALQNWDPATAAHGVLIQSGNKIDVTPFTGGKDARSFTVGSDATRACDLLAEHFFRPDGRINPKTSTTLGAEHLGHSIRIITARETIEFLHRLFRLR